MSKEEPILPPEQIKEALEEETNLFQEFYRWLEKSMPRLFFNEVEKEWISYIVHGLRGFPEQDYFSEIHFKNAAITLCVDSPEIDIRILRGYPHYGIKNYTTYISREPLPFPGPKRYLRIATLYFTELRETPLPPLGKETREELSNFLTKRHADWGEKRTLELIDQIDPPFLRKMPLEQRILAVEMFERSQTRDQCQYEIHYESNWEKERKPSVYCILAWKNVPKHNFLYRLAQLVSRHGLMMRRINGAYIHPYRTNGVFMLAFGLHGKTGNAAWEAADITDFLQELVTLKYFGSEDLINKTFVQSKLLSGNDANFVRATSHFIHQLLSNLDPNLYSFENIEEGLCRHPELTIKICEAFEHKFHPNDYDLEKYEAMRQEFLALVDQLDTGHETHDKRRKNILHQGMNFVEYLLKCNFYRTNKTALSFRLDPHYLDHAPFDRKELFPELPYAIFFIKGMHFVSFHIRFRDLSRGGLRTIYPLKKEHALAERHTVFLECYHLAYTQQKKNKDIPEGGAKGVIFLKPYRHLVDESEILARELNALGMKEEAIEIEVERFIATQGQEYLYETQRSFIATLLSLVNCNPDGSLRSKHIVDYWKEPEYLYLGPDENMHDSMIEWIAQFSIAVKYKPGGAFISGKPRLGINHKEYGVTSRGVNVYMHTLLKYLNIDPFSTPFTVKMTGGPDGDVAGNQILNLYHHYPDTARLIALTDGSGTIYDPEGLDLEICAALFKEGKAIRFYPPEKLNVGGFLLDRENRREPTPYIQQTLCWRQKDGSIEADWLSGSEMNALYRNNVHQTLADIFLPCGGRPRTLRDSNYQEFLDKTGEPTARAIVEGANLYISPWARKELEKLGVLIIKDSSANKGGVICSSFEILCGLTISDKEFLNYRSVLVQQIIDRLEECAQNEANLLLKTHSETQKPLSEISDDISRRINMYTDQLLDYLFGIELSDNARDPLIHCFLHYCPDLLHDRYRRNLLSEVPENHKKAVIASHIAAKLVYKRGLSWFPSLVDILPIILHDKELLK